MKRFLHRFYRCVLFASLYAVGVAQSPAPMASGSMSSGSSTKCPAGDTYVKGYTNAEGTKVKGISRLRAAPAKSAKCPTGETYVNLLHEVRRHGRKGILPFIFDELEGSMSTATHAPSMMGSPAPAAHLARNAK